MTDVEYGLRIYHGEFEETPAESAPPTRPSVEIHTPVAPAIDARQDADQRPSDPRDNQPQAPNLLVLALIGISSLFLLGPLPAPWSQPSCVGMLWGGVFFLGFLVGSSGRGNAVSATLGLAFFFTNTSALHTLTDISHADCFLLTACLSFSGWFTAWTLPVPGCKTHNIRQVSIWDLCFLTFLAACLSHSLPNLSSDPMLLFAVLLAMVGGILTCWLACRWVLHDQWTLGSTSILLGGLMLALACLLSPTFSSGSTWNTLKWTLTGPLHVIASQSTLVILLMAVLRRHAEIHAGNAEALHPHARWHGVPASST